MNEKILLDTLKGLEMTSIEKIKRLGVEDAQDDLERIKDMIDEIVCFWELPESLMDEYDDRIKFAKNVEKF